MSADVQPLNRRAPHQNLGQLFISVFEFGKHFGKHFFKRIHFLGKSTCTHMSHQHSPTKKMTKQLSGHKPFTVRSIRTANAKFPGPKFNTHGKFKYSTTVPMGAKANSVVMRDTKIAR